MSKIKRIEMGEITDAIINGEFDCITGEYIGEGAGYPRTLSGNHRKFKKQNETPSERKIRAVRKELALIIKDKTKNLTSEKDVNRAVEESRSEINRKYGKGWRERGLTSDSNNQWTEEDLKNVTPK